MPARALRLPHVALLAAALAAPAAAASPTAAPLQVSGRMSTEGRSPVGATVELLPLPGGPGVAAPAAVHATPRPDGSFTLTAPAPGLYRLRAAAPGHGALEVPLLPVVEDLELPTAALRREQPTADDDFSGGDGPPLWLPPGLFGDRFESVPGPTAPLQAAGAPTTDPSTVAGRVLDAASRQPLAGTLVWFLSKDQMRWTLTGPDGGFRLPVRPAEQNRLEAAAAGHAGTVRESVRPGEAATLLLERAAALAGVVVSAAGRPVAGATVRVSGAGEEDGFDAHRRHARQATSDADGRFRLPGLLPQRLYELAASHGEHAPARLLARAPAAGAEAPPLRFVLGAGQTALGRVVDPEGLPVAGAEITLHRSEPRGPQRLALVIGSGGARAASDTQGSFRFHHLEPGDYELAASASGFAPSAAMPVAVTVQATEFDLGELTLQRGVTLEGRVTGPKGEPLQGAHVGVWPEGRFLAHHHRIHRAPVLTAADGRFRVTDLAPGERLRVHVDHRDYAPFHTTVAVPTAEPLAIELLAKGALTVRVVGPEGEPVAGAQVTAIVETRVSKAGASSSSGRTGHGLGATNAEGNLTAQPQPGTLDLEVTAAGYERRVVRGVEVPAGGEARPLEIALRRAPVATLVGRVVDHLGQPLPGFNVQAEPVGDHDPELFDPYLGEEVRTDADGAYRIEGLRPGRYAVEARGAGQRTARGAITLGTGTARLDLAIERGVEVSGRVLDEEGEPAGGVKVGLWALSGYRWWSTSAADGSFLFEWVPDGTYRLIGRASGYAETAAPSEVQVAGSAVGGLELRLGERSGAIVGRILGLGPADLQRVWLQAFGRRLGIKRGTVGPEGSYRIPDLAPGEWEVKARLDGGSEVSGTVTLVPEQDAILDLEFEPRATVIGRASLDGRPLAGARIQFAGQRSGAVETAHDGGFQLALTPGRYTLILLEPRQGIGYSRTVDVGPEGAEVAIELTAASLSGRVLARDSGVPIDGAVVSAEGFNAALDLSYSGPSARTDAAGLFELPRLAPGHYRLTVSADGFAPATAEVELPEGRAVELEVPLAPAAEADREDGEQR